MTHVHEPSGNPPEFSGPGDLGDSAEVAKRIFFGNFHHLQNSVTEHLTFKSPSEGKLRFRIEATLQITYSWRHRFDHQPNAGNTCHCIVSNRLT